MTTHRPLSSGPEPAPQDRHEPAIESRHVPCEDPMNRYKEALRERLPCPEDIYRAADQRRRARRSATKTGITAVAVATLATCIWIADPVYRSESFATDARETNRYTLADGSVVTLNTGSTLHVQWRLLSRRLQVERGEVMFRVAHGARPFIVKATDATIRDIGTVFNVRLEPGKETPNVTVTVMEGAVEVRTATEHAVINSGQTADLGPRGLKPPRLADPATLATIQNGKLVFDGTPLDQAVAEMRLYRPDPIGLNMPDVHAAALRLSGEFDHQRIDALLDLLPTILPVHVQRLPGGRVVISAASTGAARPEP